MGETTVRNAFVIQYSVCDINIFLLFLVPQCSWHLNLQLSHVRSNPLGHAAQMHPLPELIFLIKGFNMIANLPYALAATPLLANRDFNDFS